MNQKNQTIMRIRTIKPIFGTTLLLGFALAVLVGCQPEDSFGDNGLTDTSMDASFNIAPVEGQPNQFVLQAENSDFILSKWDVGQGEYQGASREEIFLPDAGTYTITHIAVGAGGGTTKSSQELIVATSDPVAGNLVLGGTFESEEDIAQWTILNISASGAGWTFESGKATIDASGYNQQGIFQAIEVQGGKNYMIDMNVSGSGAVETWFEVFLSPVPPVQFSDYSADGNRIGLNTWAGCATTAFSGKLSQLGCAGSGNVVGFDVDSTVYLVIKCGGNNVGGITIDNVELRGTD